MSARRRSSRYKAFLKETFATYDSTNDLYVFFQEQEIRQLRAGGRMGMIVANKWMRAGYGERLRDFLQRVGRPLEVIDFGHSPIFPDADTFPCILIVTKRARALAERERPGEDERLSACEVPREHWSDRMDLGAFVSSRRRHIATGLLRRERWSLEDARARLLLERIRTKGVPLAAYCGQKPMFGIKTGLTEAYVIDEETRAALIRKSKTSARVIKPLLRGRDIDRWRLREGGVYLILIPSSENQSWDWSDASEDAEAVFREKLPAIYEHMSKFKEKLMERRDQGRYYWELRSCDYMESILSEKIVWQDLAYHSRFGRSMTRG